MHSEELDAHRERMSALLHTAALVLPPYGVEGGDLDAWVQDLVKVTRALGRAEEMLVRECNPRWLQGVVIEVENPAKSMAGKVLNAASVKIRSEFGAKDRTYGPDNGWIDLRTAEGKALAEQAARLVGKRVRYQLMTQVDLQDGRPILDANGNVKSRSVLKAITLV